MFEKIMVYGNEVLRKSAEPVEVFDDKLKETVEKMFVTMKRADGIGLAAPQIGISKQIIVIDVSEYEGPKIALINPVIKSKSRQTEIADEGCLSIPGVRGDVERAKKITVEAFDLDGKKISFTARDLYARVIQHEKDHLDGILFTDRVDESTKVQINPILEDLKSKESVAVA